jgi:hypothetical protein
MTGPEPKLRAGVVFLSSERATAVLGACDKHDAEHREPRYEGNSDHGVVLSVLKALLRRASAVFRACSPVPSLEPAQTKHTQIEPRLRSLDVGRLLRSPSSMTAGCEIGPCRTQAAGWLQWEPIGRAWSQPRIKSWRVLGDWERTWFVPGSGPIRAQKTHFRAEVGLKDQTWSVVSGGSTSHQGRVGGLIRIPFRALPRLCRVRADDRT